MNTPPTPAARLSLLIMWLSKAMDTPYLTGRLAPALFNLIVARLIGIRDTVARIAARLAAGRPAQRRSPAPRPPVARTPRAPGPLPYGYAWLIRLVPEAAASGSQLRALLADPEMAAFLAAAPAQLRRPIRSLCRMLAVEAPAVLALPQGSRRTAPATAPEPRPVRARRRKPPRVRYVFGLRYPAPFPDPV